MAAYDSGVTASDARDAAALAPGASRPVRARAQVAAIAVAAGHDVLATQLHAPPPHGRALRLDLRDDEAVQRVLMKHGPELVVHTAYRQADEALEGDVVRATRNVALASHRVGARLVHVSTDLVFDGEEGAPYDEDAEPRPVSAYGRAKLDAEALARQLHPEALVAGPVAPVRPGGARPAGAAGPARGHALLRRRDPLARARGRPCRRAARARRARRHAAAAPRGRPGRGLPVRLRAPAPRGARP